ncbi:MAG: phenylacetate--CoA ligase [Candidatus Thermoplasmatota archaeon]|jgi:phenylacetate-CoA ligase|nr:phenylacetate--CoA ligase [Candidatus Thermoplasmatota archaeon]
MFQEKEQFLTTDEIKELQLERLKKQVKRTYKNVPMYRKRFDEAGIKPSDIKELSDISKLPFTYKDDLRDHYPYGIRAVPIERLNRIHASSGTTGIPTVVSYTSKDLDTWSNLMARCYSCAGVTENDLIQNAYGYGLFTGGLGFHMGAERLGALVIPTATGNTKRQIKMMKDMGSTVICCTPSYAVFLIESLTEEGVDPSDLKLRIGMFGAEPWSEETRHHIQSSLNIRAQDLYGMSELYGPGVAVECERQDGLHIWADEFLIETIDPDTQEVLPPGTRGEMVFTMLTREAMPLLRYRTKDLAVINWEKCACGRSHPRVMRIRGRSDDMLIVGGVNVFPSQIEDVLMSIDELGEQFQIILETDRLDHLNVQVEVSPAHWGVAEKVLAGKVEEALQATLTLRARVELVAPGTIPRTEGKAKRVIDKRKMI